MQSKTLMTFFSAARKNYDFIEAMIRACRNSDTTDRIHIGMDEAFMPGWGLPQGVFYRQQILLVSLKKFGK